MKTLAVLIHGQPRFINYTWKFIKEEYTIPDIETHYFAHMWEDVGYSPQNSIDNQYTKLNLPGNVKKDLTVLKIDNYDILYDFVAEFHPKIREIMLNKYKPVTPGKLHSLSYRYGQHFSKQEAYKLLKEYENKNNIKFDIVAIIKTDFVYKNKQCYETEEEYIQEKINLYKNINSDSNLLKNVTAMYREFSNYNTVADSYNIPHNKLVSLRYKEPFDRLQLNDHWLLCSRDIAHHYCIEWFDTCLQVLRELKAVDIEVSDEERFKYHSKDKCPFVMFGEILIRNKLNLIRIKKRFKRLIDPDNCKEKFLVKNRDVVHCKENLDVDTQHQNIQNRIIELFSDRHPHERGADHLIPSARRIDLQDHASESDRCQD
jgi:hypothetical protein